MATIQAQIDQMAGKGFSVANLSLNAAGVAKMAAGKKDVYLTYADKGNPYEVLSITNKEKLGFAADYLGLNSVIMYADVTDGSDLCEHPIESGAKIVDHQIQRPVEVKLQIVLPYYLYDRVYQQLKQLKESGTYVCVHTKAGIYNRMIFKDIPHKESVENIDRLVFDCVLKQAFEVTGETSTLTLSDVKYASEADTKKTGIKKPKPKGKDESFLTSIKNSLGNVLSDLKNSLRGQ